MSSTMPTKLKLFGFNLSKEDASTSNITSSSTTHHKKYECQYCLREFVNSQALGGHQNAHKKERQEHKRALAAAAIANNATLFSAFFSSDLPFNVSYGPGLRAAPYRNDVLMKFGADGHRSHVAAGRINGSDGVDLHLSL